jgi:hypothetical protein
MLAAGYPKALIPFHVPNNIQYIKLNIHGEISIIVVQAHSGRKRVICT